jgi:O-antigen/teichoic acid export membrane protein
MNLRSLSPNAMVDMLKSSTFRNTGWSALGSVANGVVGAVSSAILARYLGVHDFGTLTLILALLTLVTDLSDLGINSALVKFGAEAARDEGKDGFSRVASSVLRLKFMLGTGVIVAAFFLFKPIVTLFFSHIDPAAGALFQFSLIAAVLVVPASFFPALLQASQLFRTYSLAMFSRYGSRLIFLLLCVFLVSQWTLELMVWVEIGSALVFLLAGYFLSPTRRFALTQRDPVLERRVLGFGKWIVLYQVISLLGGKVDVFFVGGIADAAALGLYGAAMKIAGVVSVATYSYFTALVPEFSMLATPEAVIARRRGTFGIALLMVAGIGILALIADPIILVLFGEQYAAASALLRVVCIGLALNVIGHPFSAVLFSQNRPQVFPVGSTIAILVFGVANAVLIPAMGVMGAAVAFVLHAVALLTVTLVYYRLWRKERGIGG